jgi:threonine-phosphate decarboxylase
MKPETVTSVERVVHGSDDSTALDFSANCNPCTPSGTQEVYEAAFENARSYPRDDYPDYRAAVAEYLGCSLDQEQAKEQKLKQEREQEQKQEQGLDQEQMKAQIIPTAGGIMALRLTIETTVSSGDSVLVPFPSFGEYAREVRLQGAIPKFVPHDELLDADLEDHALAIICTPNNPTGALPERDRLLAYASRCRDVNTSLLVDEAFLDFTDQSSLAGTPGVVIARSLTKMFGVPGLRAGYVVARGELYERLRAAVPPWALGSPAAAVGTHCLRATDFVAETRERVRTERERVREALTSQFEVYPSNAPFLLLDTGTDPKPIIATLRSRDIAVRDATTFRGLDSHIRVAVRMPDENDQLIEALLDIDV